MQSGEGAGLTWKVKRHAEFAANGGIGTKG